jgi:hypothetical protein
LLLLSMLPEGLCKFVAVCKIGNSLCKFSFVGFELAFVLSRLEMASSCSQ